MRQFFDRKRPFPPLLVDEDQRNDYLAHLTVKRESRTGDGPRVRATVTASSLKKAIRLRSPSSKGRYPV